MDKALSVLYTCTSWGVWALAPFWATAALPLSLFPASVGFHHASLAVCCGLWPGFPDVGH